jgi:hypothetical protein
MDEPGPEVPFAPMSYIDNIQWDDEAEEILWLLTPFELEAIPKGTVLTSIIGTKAIVGDDYIDTDTHFGYTAFGLTEDQFKH